MHAASNQAAAPDGWDIPSSHMLPQSCNATTAVWGGALTVVIEGDVRHGARSCPPPLATQKGWTCSGAPCLTAQQGLWDSVKGTTIMRGAKATAHMPTRPVASLTRGKALVWAASCCFIQPKAASSSRLRCMFRLLYYITFGFRCFRVIQHWKRGAVAAEVA